LRDERKLIDLAHQPLRDIKKKIKEGLRKQERVEISAEEYRVALLRVDDFTYNPDLDKSQASESKDRNLASEQEVYSFFK
jgi:hypothetical protein